MGTKGFYPEGTARLMGGGVDNNEDLLDAVQREMKEETGLILDKEEFEPLIEVKVEGQHEDEIHRLSVFVYFVELDDEEAIASDDVEEILMTDEAGFRKINQVLLNLPHDFMAEKDNGVNFSWGDYGKVYGFIQEKALDEVLARKL